MSGVAMRPRRVSAGSANRRLGALLVAARNTAGFTQETGCKAVGFSKRKLQMIETAETVVSAPDLDRLLEQYGIPDGDRPAWHELAGIARAKGWWEAYDRAALSADYKRFIGLEQGATRIRAFQPLLIHGLLQTPSYRQVVMAATSVTQEPAERVAVLLEISRRRQEALEGPEPIELWAVLDEAAVHRVVGERTIMNEQLRHLAELAEQRDNITVQVIPYEAGPHPGLNGSFGIMELGWPDDPGLAYIEASNRPFTYLERVGDIWTYAGMFDRLVALALPREESVKMLRDLAD